MRQQLNPFHRRLKQRIRTIEALERRDLLAVTLASSVEVSPDWFQCEAVHCSSAESREPASRISSPKVASFIGPRAAESSEWIVSIAPDTLSNDWSLRAIAASLQSSGVEFEVMRGLGTPGMVQVRGFATQQSEIPRALHAARGVVAYEPNRSISTTMRPDDPEFGSQTGLHNVGQFGATVDADVDALEAWEISTGSPGVVVGIIDSGIDLTHPDLFLNIWINQGEIPQEKLRQIVDVDQDALITFYDLNSAVNAPFSNDFNDNGYIDANDLIADPLWTDGVDTDTNGFIDDFFGWNFRTGTSEAFAPNNPADALGHGTHVAGIIGAVGNNGLGITGVNWRTSLMSLKFLDENNSGDLASAVAATNYATMMRTQYSTNVRVLNNSWGQSGSESQLLKSAADAAGNAGILVVAAAGNGNVLGQGIDIDRNPFYPASLSLDNVISVAASDRHDELASFSNFGSDSVDLLAPGVGVVSTLPGGRYGEANGTSMAAPFVAGAAALIWSELPNASMTEVRQAILNSTDHYDSLSTSTTTSGRLNINLALRSAGFAPIATLAPPPLLTSSTSAPIELAVTYSDRNQIDSASIDAEDLVVTHQWGEPASLAISVKPGSIIESDDKTTVSVTYLVEPPGGTWDPIDFGSYVVATTPGGVRSLGTSLVTRQETIGSFRVRIDSPQVIYVHDYQDTLSTGSLRWAIGEANSEPQTEWTIILDSGIYELTRNATPDPDNLFAQFTPPLSCNVPANTSFSTSETGDLEILGHITIIGAAATTTQITGAVDDRIFKVHDSGSLTLKRLSLSGGNAEAGQDGGAILSAGNLTLEQVSVFDNYASENSSEGGRGGAIAAWAGTVSLTETHLTANSAATGGAIFACGDTVVEIATSTIDDNHGGGITSYATADGQITNTTIATNSGPAIAVQQRAYPGGDGASSRPSISSDGRFVSFQSDSPNLVEQDTNSLTDSFLLDTVSQQLVRTSVSSQGYEANQPSSGTIISGDGTTVVFVSTASNLINGDDLFSRDVFAYERDTQNLIRVNQGTSGVRTTRGTPAVSHNGRYIAYQESVFDDPINNWGIYLFDLTSQTSRRIPLVSASWEINAAYLDQLDISADGRWIVVSAASSGANEDVNHKIYIYDTQQSTWSIPSDLIRSSTQTGSDFQASLSANGQLLTFTTDEDILAAQDSNGHTDVYAVDLGTNELYLVSHTLHADISGNNNSFQPDVSGDGRLIAFASHASDLIDLDTNQQSDVFVWDRISNSVQRMSVDPNGDELASGSMSPAISSDGRFVAFESLANTVVTSHANHQRSENGESQIYLRELPAQVTRSVSYFELTSTLYVNHATIAFNAADETVSGNVTLQNTLSAGNLGEFDFGSRVASNGHNILSAPYDAQRLSSSDLITSTAFTTLGTKTQASSLPPAYPLLLGSPAIDAAASGIDSPVFDQWLRIRTSPDIGALEATSAILAGHVFADADGDGNFDTTETLLSDFLIFVDANNDGVRQPTEAWTISSALSGPNTMPGSWEFGNLSPGLNNIRIEVPADWTASSIPLRRIGSGAIQGNGPSTNGKTSLNGELTGFVSTASNLVPGDSSDASVFVFSNSQGTIRKLNFSGTNLEVLGFVGSGPTHILLKSATGIYLYDLDVDTSELISRSTSGVAANAHSDSASSSEDGRWITFSSFADNLVPNDNDAFADIFLFDSLTQETHSVTQSALGHQGNNDSEEPTISSDGRYISFISDASNLVPADTNSLGDAFVFDRILNTIRRVNVSRSGEQSNGFTYAPQISRDGSWIVFQSLATNLVTGTPTAAGNIFLASNMGDHIERLDLTFPAIARTTNYRPSISDDGQYIAFNAPGQILSNEASSQINQIYVYDRSPNSGTTPALTDRLQLVSLGRDGTPGSGHSTQASISGNGRWIVWQSLATNLISSDTNQFSDLFFAINPFEAASQLVSLAAGELRTDFDFAVTPLPGQISGTVFNDLSDDRRFDEGDPTFADWLVYLDINDNARFDISEPSARTDVNGQFSFSGIASYREYEIRVEAPPGWQPVTPSDGAHLVFLSPASNVEYRDFGYVSRDSAGQSRNSSISGVIFSDLNGNGVRDDNEAGSGAVPVYLDLNGNEQRDFDEPRTVTSEDGSYSFTGLGGRAYTIRINVDESEALTSPLGNEFTERDFTFSTASILLSKPQDVVVADLDGDAAVDAAVALFSGNSISIVRNRNGGDFETEATSVNLPPEDQGPIALAQGDFNNDGLADLVAVNSLSYSMTVLTTFNGTTFQTITSHPLTNAPTDVVVADINGDHFLDIVVTLNRGTSEGLVQIFLNDGQGNFSALAAVLTGGARPVALSVTDVNGDELHDLVIANQGSNSVAGNTGNIAVILGTNGVGNSPTFGVPSIYGIGTSPMGVTVGDLTGDAIPEIAYTSFTSNTVSVLSKSSGNQYESVLALSVGKGPVQIEAIDLDRDNDLDLIVSNLSSQTLSILRNRADRRGSLTDVRFEPAETYGVAEFSIGPRLSFAAADLDASGTPDLAVVNSESNRLRILKNSIVNGANRVLLTGVDSADQQDFGTYPIILLPTLDEISDVIVAEDASPISLTLTGIQRGRSTGPALRITATSDQPTLIHHPAVEHQTGHADATIELVPAAGRNGIANITVEVRDAGADELFDTTDDGVVTRQFRITVTAVNDSPHFAMQGNLVTTLGTSLRLTQNFATGFMPGGGPDEASQTIAEYIVLNSAPELFIVQPHIDNTGTLRYQPGLTTTGIATVTVQVRDSGGSANGGSDRSASQSFQILVTNLADDDYDFGDAPSALNNQPTRYATSLADNGARHRASELYLGSAIDFESDGQPSESADGDDVVFDDEDGVAFVSPIVASTNLPSRSAVAVVSSGAGLIDAWIDFNQDGDWADSGEQVLAGEAINAGQNLLSFTVPTGILSGLAYARFRLSTTGYLSWNGAAEDGEVEDYSIVIIDENTSASVNLDSSLLGDHEVLVVNGQLQVRRDGLPLISIDARQVSDIAFENAIQGRNLYRVSLPAQTLSGVLTVQPDDSRVLYRSSETTVDLSNSEAFGIHGVTAFDLQNNSPQQIPLSPNSLSQLNSTGIIEIQLGVNDGLLPNNSTWRLTSRTVVDSALLHTFESGNTSLKVSGPANWHNYLQSHDVNGDGQVTPIDALIIVNHLNRSTGKDSRGLPSFSPLDPLASYFVDVNGDDFGTPLDALVVINHLNRRNNGSGEHALQVDEIMQSWHIGDDAMDSDE